MNMSFVEMLRSGTPALGTWVQMRAPEMVDLIGGNGFDFAIVDCEHGAFGIETAEQLVRACDAARLAPVVRVSRLDRVEIMKALDAGAGAVLVPNVSSAEDAAAAVAATRYAPQGTRGACPCTRSVGHYARATGGGRPGRAKAAQGRSRWSRPSRAWRPSTRSSRPRAWPA